MTLFNLSSWPHNEQLSRTPLAAHPTSFTGRAPIATMKFAKYAISCTGHGRINPILTIPGNSNAIWCLNGG